MSILIPKTVCVSCGAFYHTQTALCMVYYSQNRLCMVKLELLYTTDWSNGLEESKMKNCAVQVDEMRGKDKAESEWRSK